MMRKLIVELIGTFFLVFTIGLVVTAASPTALAPLAIGGVLMVMVYAGGHISGAHYNPAITLAVFLRKKATAKELLGYWIAQLIGAIAAGALVGLFATALKTPTVPDYMAAGIVEFLFTFALAWVVLNVATTRGTEGNSYYGLAIGFTVMAGAFAAGPISGGVFNPAVAVGITVTGLSAGSALPLYFIATFGGAAFAAVLFNVLDLGNDKATTATPAEQADLHQVGSPSM